MENEALFGYRDYPAQRRTLERILQKLWDQDSPGAPYVEQYLRHMHRRDLTANTLRAAFISLQGFLTFLKNQGKTDLLAVVHNDLEVFVECLQDRGLKPVSVENNRERGGRRCKVNLLRIPRRGGKNEQVSDHDI
jgi:hypothetical protein